VTEALDKETQGDKKPDAAPQVASSRAPVIAVSLAIICIATANFLPSYGGFSLPDFKFSLPSAEVKPT